MTAPRPRIALIIPARDESKCITDVVLGFASVNLHGEKALSDIVVADNGSTDGTGASAELVGAHVVREPRPGYGNACLAGMARLRELGAPDVVVFADGDGSNDPHDLPLLVAPILCGRSDFVIGSRRSLADPGSLTIPQRFGNVFATELMRAKHGGSFTDLGPFRAIRWTVLESLGMQDPNYGWTIEMQLKALKLGVRWTEVSVRNHARAAGRSKVSGTVKGVFGAGTKIIGTVLRYR